MILLFPLIKQTNASVSLRPRSQVPSRLILYYFLLKKKKWFKRIKTLLVFDMVVVKHMLASNNQSTWKWYHWINLTFREALSGG